MAQMSAVSFGPNASAFGPIDRCPNSHSSGCKEGELPNGIRIPVTDTTAVFSSSWRCPFVSFIDGILSSLTRITDTFGGNKGQCGQRLRTLQSRRCGWIRWKIREWFIGFHLSDGVRARSCRESVPGWTPYPHSGFPRDSIRIRRFLCLGSEPSR